MDDLERAIAHRKARLDARRPLLPGALDALERWYDVELTYTSNAIEGNTLTRAETALVIEKGVTVGGKRLRDHLEALDHHAALGHIRALAGGAAPLDEAAVRELHRRVLAKSQPDIAGVYSAFQRRIAGSATILPAPAKIPGLMAAFGAWLAAAPVGWQTAFEAHRQLVAIHPFSDGNGRTARLLMNLVLLRAGYPPVSVGPEERAAYLDALEAAGTADDTGPYDRFMAGRLVAALDLYLGALDEADEAARRR
jgi:Fic family protein